MGARQIDGRRYHHSENSNLMCCLRSPDGMIGIVHFSGKKGWIGSRGKQSAGGPVGQRLSLLPVRLVPAVP